MSFIELPLFSIHGRRKAFIAINKITSIQPFNSNCLEGNEDDATMVFTSDGKSICVMLSYTQTINKIKLKMDEK